MGFRPGGGVLLRTWGNGFQQGNGISPYLNNFTVQGGEMGKGGRKLPEIQAVNQPAKLRHPDNLGKF